MMLVKFKVNLGSEDAAKHSLDYRKCQQDMELDVEDEVGEWLCTQGIAECLRGTQTPAAIKAVPPEWKPEQKQKPKSVSSEE